jgi:hypothetical protein
MLQFRSFLLCLGLVSVAVLGCSQDGADAIHDVPAEYQGQDAADGDLASPEDAIAGADSSRPDVHVPGDLWPDYDGLDGARGIFLETRAGFFDQPFPCDLRRRGNGAPDFSDFPNPTGNPLLVSYIAVAQDQLDGFSPNGAIYVRFDDALDPLRFPKPSKTVTSQASVQLVNVTKGSSRYSERVPVELGYFPHEAPSADYYLQRHVLMVRPVGGFPLAFGETYALLVMRTLLDVDGRYLGRTETVARAMEGEKSSPLFGLFGPVRDLIKDEGMFRAEDIAVATVFTVSDPISEMVNTASFIWTDVDVEVSEMAVEYGSKSNMFLLEGTYLGPNFQKGLPPYEEEGQMVFVSAGHAKLQRVEPLKFVVSLPKGDMPGDGWPVVQYSHGTGGSRRSFVHDGTAGVLASMGIAGISIDQPIHGDRWNGPAEMLELYSFNFMNPRSARCLFRQAALDNVALTKLLHTLSVEHGGQTHVFDPERIGYFGHSQGGLTGALFVAVEDGLKGAVLSGAGGGLAYTILLRKQIDSDQPVDIKAMLEQLLALKFPGELDLFHPVLTLLQSLVDVTDPLNYSPYYFWPRIRQQPLNVLITEGVDDPYTPALTTENLALAGRIPMVKPVQHEHMGFPLAGLVSVQTPVSNNMVCPDGASSTAGLIQFKDQGHFVVFDDKTCIKMWSGFLDTALSGGPAVINK